MTAWACLFCGNSSKEMANYISVLQRLTSRNICAKPILCVRLNSDICGDTTDPGCQLSNIYRYQESKILKYLIMIGSLGLIIEYQTKVFFFH